MSGTGGDDFICGHCGYVILEDFDPSTVRGNPVYQCGICENNNDLPFAANDRRYCEVDPERATAGAAF
jgi:hypothetical protein